MGDGVLRTAQIAVEQFFANFTKIMELGWKPLVSGLATFFVIGLLGGFIRDARPAVVLVTGPH